MIRSACSTTIRRFCGNNDVESCCNWCFDVYHDIKRSRVFLFCTVCVLIYFAFSHSLLSTKLILLHCLEKLAATGKIIFNLSWLHWQRCSGYEVGVCCGELLTASVLVIGHQKKRAVVSPMIDKHHGRTLNRYQTEPTF